jgi:hypothetical protein
MRFDPVFAKAVPNAAIGRNAKVSRTIDERLAANLATTWEIVPSLGHGS